MAFSLGLKLHEDFGAVLGAPGSGAWAAGSVPYRAARAMAPLALVLLGHERAGDFGTGALLVGALTVTEVLLAPAVVRRVPPAAGLLTYAVCLAAVPTLPLGSAPGMVSGAVLAAVAGAAAAGMAGRSRATLLTLVPAGSTTPALSLDSALSAGLYAVGPVLVAVAAPVSAALPLGLIVACAALSAVAVSRRSRMWRPGVSAARDRTEPAAAPGVVPATRVARLVWPTLLAGAGFMGLTSALEVVLPARLAEVDRIADAGYLLGAFAGIGMLAGLAYGAVARRLPGTDLQRSVACTLAMCVLLVPVAWSGGSALVVALLLAGALGPPGLIARAAHLQGRVPATELATAYAMLSSCYGLGTGVAVIVVGPVVDLAGPGATWLAALGVTALLTTVGVRTSAAGETRRLP